MEQLTAFAPFVKRERSWEGRGDGGPVLVKWGEYERGCWPGCPRVLVTGGVPPFLVRELHPGPSLQDMAPLAIGPALELFAKVLSALSELHRHGVVHGRLKPSNVFASGLTDAGLMVPESEPSALLFRAPELSGASPAPVGPQADLYSAGAVLYFMLVGAPPFVAENLSQALRAPFIQPLPTLIGEGRERWLRLALDAMLTRLMSLDPRDRYSSAAEVRADLELLSKSPKTFVPGAGELRERLAPPAFVGRTELLNSFREHLEQGGFLQLVGEAGCGKSRLAEQARRLAHSKGFLVLRGRARQGTADAPLQVLDELCQELLSQTDKTELERILTELGVWRTVVRTALPALGGSGDHDPEAYAWIRTCRALANFLQVLGRTERPALLILEDLHWSPPDTLEILSGVRESPNVALLITSRRELSLPGQRLEVPKLSLSESELVACSVLGRCQAAIPSLTAQASQGNPYRLASLLRGWTQDGSLRPSPEGWLAPEGLSRAQPDGEPPAANLLDSPTREVLSLAAVAGRELEPELLSRLFEASTVELALSRGTNLGLLHKSGPREWSFAHDLTRDAVLGWRPTSRGEQHLKLAHALWDWQPQRDQDISYHFHQAGLNAQALPFARRAAAAARERNALSSAETYLQIALAGAPEDTELWKDLGDVQRIAGNFEAADHSYGRALSLAVTPLSRARILGCQAEAAFGAGRLEAARDLFRQALALLGHTLPSGRWSKNLALLRELLALARPPARSGELSEAQRLALRMLDHLAYVLAYSDGYGLIWANLRCLNLARRAAPGRELGVALITHAVAIQYIPPLVSRASRIAGQALELVERFGTEYDRAAAMARAGTIALFGDNPAEALRLDELAVPILQRSGDRYDAHMAAYNQGLALYFLGRLEQSRGVLRENLRECLALEDSLGCGHTLRVLALLDPLSDELIDSVQESPAFPSVRTLMAEVRGLHHLRRGELREAIAHLESASKVARGKGDVFENLWSGSFLVRARRLLAQQEQGAHRTGLELLAEKEGRRTLRLAMKGYLVFVPRLCRELALLLLQQGRMEAARDLLEQGLSMARRCEMRFEEALALWELAELARLSGAYPEELRAEALRLFRLTGGTWERSSSGGSPPGVALAERFDQVILWSQTIASRHSISEVVEAARQAAEALLRCRSVRLPTRDDGIEVRTVEPRESDTLSALTIPLPWAGEPATELYCTSRDLEDFFGQEELRLAGLIQGQARVALSNAHLWAELQEREAHLERLFSSVPAGIAVVDRRGVVLQGNPRLSEMLGRSPLDSELAEHLQADDRPWFEDALRSLESGRMLQRELRLNMPDGRTLWGELSLQRLPGTEARAIVALADVSQRRLEQIAIFQDRERHMLASEVHDVLSQPLVALQLRLEAMSQQHSEARAALKDSAQTARDVLDDARGLIARLRSPHVEHLRLSLAIEDAVGELVDLEKTEVRVQLDLGLDDLPALSTLFAYRIVVESLTNCNRHARAGKVRLRLRLRQGRLKGIIADDGVGFSLDGVASGHFGLRIVRERAELLGGRAWLRTAPGRGTTVLFHLPTEHLEA